MNWQGFYERCLREDRARAHLGQSINDRAWKLGPFTVTTIFGPTAEQGAFKTDIQIGHFAVHVFWREDVDPALHDHQHDFWTFPLVSYDEEVLKWGQLDGEIIEGRLFRKTVRAFRLHHRAAEYVHRLLKRTDGKPFRLAYVCRPVVTLCWRGGMRRAWGFWEPSEDGHKWLFIPWKTYIDRARA